MRVRLERCGADERTVTLRAAVAFDGRATRLTYPTRTGALLRIDGTIAGAFDGKHGTLDLAPLDGSREVTLTVERRSLPIAGLPAGDGLRWRRMLARAEQRPHDVLDVAVATDAYGALPDAVPGEVPLLGHAHLDLAWLWTYAEARRKALRTFATALRQLTIDDRLRVRAESAATLRVGRSRRSGPLRARARTGGNGLGCERRDDVGRARSARAVGRIDPAAVCLRRALHDRRTRRRARRRMAARHVRFSEHVTDAGGARRHALLRDHETAVERDDALAVSAVRLVRRRRLAPRRGRDRPLRRGGDGRPQGDRARA